MNGTTQQYTAEIANTSSIDLSNPPSFLEIDEDIGAAKIAGSSVSRSSGSEDFANLSHRVPSLMMALAAGEPDKGHAQPLHNPGTTFDERALVPGCSSFAYLAMRYLEDEAKI